jgi:hypothetical protein
MKMAFPSASRFPYRIRLQPNPDVTVADPGVIEFPIEMNFWQYEGVKILVACLFAPPNQVNRHFELFGSRVGRFGAEQPWGPIEIESSLDYNNAICEIDPTDWSQIHARLTAGQSWDAAINPVIQARSNTTVAQILYHPANWPLPRSTHYWAIMWNYGPRRIGVLYEFNNLELLQGAISMCRWFGLNWRDYITDLHVDNTLVEVTNI